MALYLACTATCSHKNVHVYYTQRALSNHINFVSICESLPRAVAKYTCLQKLLKWLSVDKRLSNLSEVICSTLVTVNSSRIALHTGLEALLPRWEERGQNNDTMPR